MSKAVLITGARAAAALDLARDFMSAGWKVHLADSVESRMARWSSIEASHHLYPPPRQRRDDFCKAVLSLVEDERIDLIVPTCEEVFHLAAPRLHGYLADKLFCPDLAVLRSLHDKLTFAELAGAAGLAAPESHAIEGTGDLESYAVHSTDWVFKPRFSRFGGETLIGPSQTALARIEMGGSEGWMAQRRVEGKEVCLHFVAYRGSVVAVAGYASNWRLKGGASFAFEPVCGGALSALQSIARTLAQAAALHGQFGCDVIIDKRGQAHLIECNPRATSGVHLLTGNARLARAITEGTMTGSSCDTPPYLGPAMIAFGLRQAILSGRIPQWRKVMAMGHDVIGRADDRMPVAGALADAAAFAFEAMRRNISTNAATTYDIEWNGEELD